MHKRIFRKDLGLSKSSSTPAPNPFQSRPFAPTPEVSPQPQEKPDLEQLKQNTLQAKSSGYNFANVNVTPRQATPLGVLQRKLTIGEAGDKYEQEADQVASRVVQQINTPSVAQSTPGQSVQSKEVMRSQLTDTSSLPTMEISKGVKPTIQRITEEDAHQARFTFGPRAQAHDYTAEQLQRIMKNRYNEIQEGEQQFMLLGEGFENNNRLYGQIIYNCRQEDGIYNIRVTHAHGRGRMG